ncbi:unnamed protein product [Diamesa serratosioi]
MDYRNSFSLENVCNGNSFQERINRMNARKEEQRLIDCEFIRTQKIRMFINDCDEIRPNLRHILLKDSKLCQAEQMRDQEKMRQEKKDVDNAWIQVQCRDYQAKTEKEDLFKRCRWQANQLTQSFLKDQIYDNEKRKLSFHQDIDAEKKQIEQITKADNDKEALRTKKEQDKKKQVSRDILSQIKSNSMMKKKQLDNDLKLERIFEEQTLKEIEKEKVARAAERDYFKREICANMEHLKRVRHDNCVVEREMDKLIEDIRIRVAAEDLRKCRNVKQKSLLMSMEARRGLLHQINQNELQLIEDASKKKREDLIFNEFVLKDRQKMMNNQLNLKSAAQNYGRELLDQCKAEELQHLYQKQMLEETLLKDAQERQRCETMGKEFVNSFQDVLPLHPNLILINKHNPKH